MTEEEQFVQELADGFWRISGNYAREGTTTPGGRFYEKTLELVQAEYALREVRRYLHFRPEPTEALRQP
jgi:hypothetical protein